jgi:hypothetical protein
MLVSRNSIDIMTRENLIVLGKKIMNAEGTEEEYRVNILLFKSNVPNPNAANYFFDIKYNDLTIEQIVDKAMSYRSIQL